MNPALVHDLAQALLACLSTQRRAAALTNDTGAQINDDAP